MPSLHSPHPSPGSVGLTLKAGIVTSRKLSGIFHGFCLTFFVLMWTIFQVFIELVTVLLLLFMFWFVAVRHVGS